MPTIDEQIANLKSQGKSESTSKSLAKLVKARQTSGGSTTVYGNTGLANPATQGISTGSISSSGNSSDVISRAIAMQNQAIQPAVNTLQQGIPEIQQKFATATSQVQAEMEPLKQRYQNLLNSIKGNQTIAENRQSVTTSGELGKRGISGDSTLAQQELTNALNPITQQYTTLATDTGLQREADLANQVTNLTGQQTESVRSVLNAIAQLQAGAGQTGISQGIQQGQFGQTLANTQAQQALDLQKYLQTTLPLAQRELNKPYYQPDPTGDLIKQLQARLIQQQIDSESRVGTGSSIANDATNFIGLPPLDFSNLNVMPLNLPSGVKLR